MENRNGLIAAAMVTHADGYAEHDAALLMPKKLRAKRRRRITVGADKAHDTTDSVRTARDLNVMPHVARGRQPAELLRSPHHPLAGLRDQPQSPPARREGALLG